MQSNFEKYKKQIEEFYFKAVWHFMDHSCGGSPFKYAKELFEEVEKYGEGKDKLNILEIGTAIGYSTFVLSLASSSGNIDSIEMEADHVELARVNLKDLQNINIIQTQAEDILPDLKDNNYDIIFFDGYAPEAMLMPHFERLLKKGGLLMTANTHKKRKTTEEYMSALGDEDKWKKINVFGDTIVHLYQ